MYIDKLIPDVGAALHAMGIELRIWRQAGKRIFETKLLYGYGYTALFLHWSDEGRA
jgi:hypothetical protein